MTYPTPHTAPEAERFDPHHQEERPPVRRSLISHIWRMPKWERGILMLAVVFVGLGIAGHLRPKVAEPAQASKVYSSPHSGFVGDQPSADTAAPSDQPWYLSPTFLRVGVSTIGGFVIGFLARAFVKTVTLGVAGIAGLLAAASYFRFFNVDFSAAHQQFDTASQWFLSQVDLLKTVAIAHLPSHTGAAMGAYMGFRKR